MEDPCVKKIIQLRKKGDDVNALILARECYSKKPWNRSIQDSYGWLLYNLVIKHLENKAILQAGEYFDELINLNIKDWDLAINIEKLLKKTFHYRRNFNKAKDMYNEERYDDNFTLFKQLIYLYPNNIEIKEGFALCIKRLIELNLSEKVLKRNKIYRLIKEYLNLGLMKRGKLHTIFLLYFMKIIDKQFDHTEFCILFDVNNLSREFEDELHYTCDDIWRYFAIKCGNEVFQRKLVDHVDYVVELIDKVVDGLGNKTMQSTDMRIQLGFYKARLMVLQNKYQEAELLIIPYIFKNIKDYSACYLLSHIHKDNFELKSLAFLVRSIILCNNIDAKLQILYLLFDKFINLNEIEFANYLVTRVVRISQHLNLEIEENVMNFMKSELYQKTDITPTITKIFKKYNALSNEYLSEYLEWTEANYIHISDEYYMIIFSFNDQIKQHFVPYSNNSNIVNLRNGTPIQIKFNDSNDNIYIFKISNRDGDLWDILPERRAIIYRNNIEKENALIIYDFKKKAYANHNDFIILKELKVGDVLKVQGFHFINKEGIETFRFCNIEKSENFTNLNFAKIIEDEVKINDDGTTGSLNNIFINSRFVTSNNLVDGDIIRCLIILAGKKKTNLEENCPTTRIKWKWQLLKILEVKFRLENDN